MCRLVEAPKKHVAPFRALMVLLVALNVTSLARETTVFTVVMLKAIQEYNNED